MWVRDITVILADKLPEKCLCFPYYSMSKRDGDGEPQAMGRADTPGPTRSETAYTYETYAPTMKGDRPLPAPPTAIGAPPGQSSRDMGPGLEVDEVDWNEDKRGANLYGGFRDKGVESFVLRQLPMFAGTYDGDLIGEWISKIQLLRNISGISDAELLRLLPLRMSTRAADFLVGHLDGLQPREATWEKVRKVLLTQYGGVADPTQLVNKLQSVKKERDMPVRQFAHEVERLARLAYPELSSNSSGDEQREVQKSILNRITLEQFTSGLPLLLSRGIVERKVTDFHEAVELAAHLEDANTRFMRKTTINALNSSDSDGRQGRQEGAGHLSHPEAQTRYHQGAGRGLGFSHPSAQHRQPTSDFYDSGNAGYYQGPPQFSGHTGAMYRPPGRGRTRPNYPLQQAGYRPGRDFQGPMGPVRQRPDPRKCYRCQGVGHFARDCLQRSFIEGPGYQAINYRLPGNAMGSSGGQAYGFPPCIICHATDHSPDRCPNVVCANCKEAGHPATKCTKNFRGRPTSRHIN